MGANKFPRGLSWFLRLLAFFATGLQRSPLRPTVSRQQGTRRPIEIQDPRGCCRPALGLMLPLVIDQKKKGRECFDSPPALGIPAYRPDRTWQSSAIVASLHALESNSPSSGISESSWWSWGSLVANGLVRRASTAARGHRQKRPPATIHNSGLTDFWRD